MVRFNKNNTILNSFVRSSNGNVAIVFAFLVPVISVMVAGGLELSNGATARNALQATLDSAVLAAARSGSLDDASLTAAGQRFVDANRSSILRDEDVSVTITSEGGLGDLTIRGEASMQLPGMFAAVVGRDYTTIEAVSEVRAIEDPQLQIALVLDVTGSMSGSKISTLRRASSDLVNYIRDRVDAPIGVVPFAQYVNVGVENRGEDGIIEPMVEEEGHGRGRRRRGERGTARMVPDPDWEGCVGSPPDPYNRRDDPVNGAMPGLSDVDCPSTPLLRLTLDRSAILNRIGDLGASGWTYIPAGLQWGWRVLSDTAPFAESPSFLEEPDDNMLQVLVLMTDGDNTRSQRDESPYHDSTAPGRADAYTQQMCDAISDDGVLIYTVAFEISNSRTRNMLRDCASEESMYFNANSNSELSAAFEAIARDVVALYISR